MALLYFYSVNNVKTYISIIIYMIYVLLTTKTLYDYGRRQKIDNSK